MENIELINILELPVFYYTELDSTTNSLREMAINGSQEGTIVMAGKQTKGRGQRDHGWYSPPGGLYFSILFKPGEIDVSGFSLVVGGSVSKGIKEYCDKNAVIKWPNDLYLKKKKIGGILCQRFADNLMVGIGLNTFAKPQRWPEDLMGKAGVLEQEELKGQTKGELFTTIIKFLFEDYQVFSSKGFSYFKEALENLSLLQGQKVVLDTGESGVVLGYSDKGGLILEVEGAAPRVCYSERVLSFDPRG